MKKIIIQTLIFSGIFFGLWFALSHLHLTEHFRVKALSKSTEEKLGNVVIDYIKKSNQQIDSDSIIFILNRIKGRICRYNNIDSTTIKLYLFKNKEVNAFALPGRNMVLYSGIIHEAENPEELASVMAHEFAHMEHRHVVKKLTKEFGVSMLMVLAGGETGTQIVKELFKIISSTSFDRQMEREADSAAVGYMIKAYIDPQHFSDMLFRISHGKADVPEHFQWISTHPETKERIETIIQLGKNHPVQPFGIISDSSWNYLKRNAEGVGN